MTRGIFFVVVWLACARAAGAWGWSVHRLVAWRAMTALAGEGLLEPKRAWPVLWKSVVAPDDRKARGYMPAEDHVFHVTLERGRRFGRAPRRAQEIAWRVTSEPLDDDETLHELGRLCHLVADLCQPLHADGKRRNPREREVHGVYERDADRDGRLGEVRSGAVAPPEPSSVEERMEALASDSVRDYDAICAAYLARAPGGEVAGYGAVAATTRVHVERAVRETVALWRGVLAHRGAERRRREEAARWSWVAAPLVLAFFAVRARWSRDPGKWPAATPITTDARRRASDEAFRELERRLGLGEDST